MGFTAEVAEGHQGSTRFFTGAMEWGELGKHAVFPEELADELDDEDEEERMQRGLAAKRIPVLVDYLTEIPDHFFSALTLIMLPSDLTQPAVEADSEGDDDADFWFNRAPRAGLGRQKRGTLFLSGAVRFFPADGQHRLKAAIEAMKIDKKLVKEEVPVVLVPYEGPDRVRQLFADLNLNAKPVSRTVGLDFDTRTPAVLIAKDVAKTVPLFIGRVNRVSNSLSKTSANTITMNALVEGTRNLLYGLIGSREPREQDLELERMQRAGEPIASDVVKAWEGVIEPFAAAGFWEPVLVGMDGAAGELREAYVFPHGLGWQALTMAAGQLMKDFGENWRELYSTTVEAIDWKRGKHWDGIAMSGERVNNTGPGIKATANHVVTRARKLAERNPRLRKLVVETAEV